MARTIGIIAAGGRGSRLNVVGGKQALELEGKPIAAWSIDAVAASSEVEAVVVVCHPLRIQEYTELFTGTVTTKKDLYFEPGGETRQESVWQGIKKAEALGAEVLVVHDGARPLLDTAQLNEGLATLKEDQSLSGVVLGHPSVDTLKRTNESGVVMKTLDRSCIWTVQTPQIFKAKDLIAAHKSAQKNKVEGTDDASLVEAMGLRIQMQYASRDNIKVTLKEDLVIAKAVLEARAKKKEKHKGGVQ